MYLNYGRKIITCTQFSYSGTPFLMSHKVQGTRHFITLIQTLDSEKMIGTPFFGGHVARWAPYFRGSSLTLMRDGEGLLQISLKLLHLYIFGRLLVLMAFYSLQKFLGFF